MKLRSKKKISSSWQNLNGMTIRHFTFSPKSSPRSSPNLNVSYAKATAWQMKISAFNDSAIRRIDDSSLFLTVRRMNHVWREHGKSCANSWDLRRSFIRRWQSHVPSVTNRSPSFWDVVVAAMLGTVAPHAKRSAGRITKRPVKLRPISSKMWTNDKILLLYVYDMKIQGHPGRVLRQITTEKEGRL